MAKGRTNYFEMNIQKKGEDFLDSKSIDEIQRDAKKRIFQDMAFGNIDYEKYGRYFMEPRFLEQLIVTARDEMENHRVKYTALKEFDNAHPGDIRVVTICAVESRLVCAYETIYYYLKTVRDSGYNISCLTDLVAQIYQYRQDIVNN